jgi:hypothetical protein
MDVEREMGSDSVNWIPLNQNRVQWLMFCGHNNEPLDSVKGMNFSTIWATISSPRKILHQGVGRRIMTGLFIACRILGTSMIFVVRLVLSWTRSDDYLCIWTTFMCQILSLLNYLYCFKTIDKQLNPINLCLLLKLELPISCLFQMFK